MIGTNKRLAAGKDDEWKLYDSYHSLLSKLGEQNPDVITAKKSLDVTRKNNDDIESEVRAAARTAYIADLEAAIDSANTLYEASRLDVEITDK